MTALIGQTVSASSRVDNGAHGRSSFTSVVSTAEVWYEAVTDLELQTPPMNNNNNNNNNSGPSPGDFPVCTEVNGPFAPFCLPRYGEDMIVDATYYVTWNADYYPLNATITIELRYPNSSKGDSAFTSDRTDNSYGYIPLHMEHEWLQGKPRNFLTLYIIELDSMSHRRASMRRGPTVVLSHQPPEHYKPSPRLAFNKLALFIGLPVSLAIVVLIVAGLFFGMRDIRRIGVGNIMGSRKGYGVGESKTQRLRGGRKAKFHGPDELSSLRRYSDEFDGTEEKGLERTGNRAFSHELSKLKNWSV